MFKKLLSIAILSLCSISAFAQTGTLTGVVSDNDTGETLPAVNVVIVELERGVATDADGNYTISNIPVGSYTVRVSYIGYSTLEESLEISSGENVFNIPLLSDIGLLDEIIVSGVADATPKKKLTVSVVKVDADKLNKVPAVSISTALSGKVSGTTIKSSSGIPGQNMEMQLRGDGNLNVEAQPLIIVDGVILQGGLNDINVDDIASIEVVKGASASSLYGSQAGNGVVVVSTKRGAGLNDGEVNVTVRNELGFQTLPKRLDLATHHAYTLANDWESVSDYTKYDGVTYPAGYAGGYHPDITGTRAQDADHYMDNPYAFTNDPQDEFFQTGTNMTNYVGVSTRQGKLNIFTSFENNTQEGIIKNVGGYERQNFRINADYNIFDWLRFSTSNLYAKTHNETLNDDGIFFDVVLAEPDNNLYALNPDGQPYYIRHNQWSNEVNPLYSTYKTSEYRDKDRNINNYNLVATPLDWFEYKFAYSSELNHELFERYDPRDTWAIGSGGDYPEYGINYTLGNLYRVYYTESYRTMQHTATARQDFGKLYAKLVLSYMLEERKYESDEISGFDFLYNNLKNFDNFSTANISSGSEYYKENAEDYFVSTSLDYESKYLFDGLVRYDGSSSFGADSRWNVYYRASAAYRITEDFDLPFFSELKVRGAIGTAGIRPRWYYQYESIDLDGGTTAGSFTLGNSELKPSETKEVEVAVSGVTFKDKLTFELIYSNAVTSDQFLSVPIIPIAGYSSQWRNAGEITADSYELSLEANILRDRKKSWSAGLVWSKSDQKITGLDVPPYLGGTSDLFYIREGESYGAIYGVKFLTSLDQLEGQLADGETIADYEINSDGFVVAAGSQGTTGEIPVKQKDEVGNDAIVKIGDGRADWTMGISNTFTYGGFSAYVLIDIKQGGDVYNRKSQWLTRDLRNGIMDMSGVADADKKTTDYYLSLYDVNSNNSYWVEDASFVKLREVALSYSFGPADLDKLFGTDAVKGITLSAIGRNLLTFTGYSGYDPEIGSIRNPVDEESDYPNFRNFAVSLTLKF